jgi:hypothetical protein
LLDEGVLAVLGGKKVPFVVYEVVGAAEPFFLKALRLGSVEL